MGRGLRLDMCSQVSPWSRLRNTPPVLPAGDGPAPARPPRPPRPAGASAGPSASPRAPPRPAGGQLRPGGAPIARAKDPAAGTAAVEAPSLALPLIHRGEHHLGIPGV